MKRDHRKVYECIEQVGNEVICTKPMYIQFPKRFVQAGFALLENPMVVLGKVAWIEGARKYYATSKFCAPFRTVPSKVSEVVVDDEPYYELMYEPGACVIVNIDLVQIDTLMYSINNEFIDKGKLPWYLTTPDDIGSLFTDSPYHASMKVGDNLGIMHVIFSTIFRDSKDRRVMYRRTLSSREDMVSKPPVIIPLRTVSYGASNTIAKTLGSYFDENVTGGLVDPAERLEILDQTLRL